MADCAYELINSYRVSVTSLTAFVNVYGDRNDYALSEMTRDGVDTVGVWGSNPHAPTNNSDKLRYLTLTHHSLLLLDLAGFS